MGKASVADTALHWTNKKSNKTGGPHHSKALSIQPKILKILVRNQTYSGLGQFCATRMTVCSIGPLGFLKFQTGIFVEWKVTIM